MVTLPHFVMACKGSSKKPESKAMEKKEQMMKDMKKKGKK